MRDFHTFFITSSYSFYRQRSNPGNSLHDEDDENNSDEEENGKEQGACGSSSEIHTGKLIRFVTPPSLNSERTQKKVPLYAAGQPGHIQIVYSSSVIKIPRGCVYAKEFSPLTI